MLQFPPENSVPPVPQPGSPSLSHQVFLLPTHAPGLPSELPVPQSYRIPRQQGQRETLTRCPAASGAANSSPVLCHAEKPVLDVIFLLGRGGPASLVGRDGHGGLGHHGPGDSGGCSGSPTEKELRGFSAEAEQPGQPPSLGSSHTGITGISHPCGSGKRCRRSGMREHLAAATSLQQRSPEPCQVLCPSFP